MIVMIDNYDSFTYNLVQYLAELGASVRVFRNDEISLPDLIALNPKGIVISPGPSTPNEAGISMQVIKHFANSIPILGVCLGHQSIGQVFGGQVVRAKTIMHGKLSKIYHNNTGIFKDLPNPFNATRYHSLIVAKDSLPNCLEITAWTQDEYGNIEEIMGLRHKTLSIEGIQFHPESILTQSGKDLLRNFLKMTFNVIIKKIIHFQDLLEEEMISAMQTIVSGQATTAQIAAFLVGLEMKGPSIGELTTATRFLRSIAHTLSFDSPITDIVGTGGDEAHTFNISTTSSFVVAAAGGKVAKHGGRSVSSSSGSADVLEYAGINLEQLTRKAKSCIEQHNIGFLYAPHYHPALRHAAVARKEIGVRTFFNLLGPLLNPAGANFLVIGVYHQKWLLPVANVLLNLACQRALVVHSADGLDEISLAAPTYVAELKNGTISYYELTPEQFGIKRQALASLRVENVAESYQLMLRVLNNEQGPARDIVLLNAGAAIYNMGLGNTIQEGILKAEDAISSGKALEKLNELIAVSGSFE